MHMINKKLQPLAVAAMALASSFAVAQGNTINVTLNGQPVIFEAAQPVEVGGRILIPIRGVLEKIGAMVDWDPSSQTVTASKNSLNVALRLGARRAEVNGEQMTLDVPAQYRNGSTMVPLRFVSQALGADVDWDPGSRTVRIETKGDNGSNGSPANGESYSNGASNNGSNSAGPVTISDFKSDQKGFVRQGSRVRFTLTGTPGGQATFEIPGVVQDVPMRETNPGTYVGEWRVPAAESGLRMTDINATAHLTVNGTERVVQTGDTFGIDSRGPSITGMRPSDDGMIGASRPIIAARFDDEGGSGIDRDSIRVSLDGRDVTGDAQISGGRVRYQPNQDLHPGRHDVDMIASDKAGNETRKEWSFQVSRKGNGRRTLNFTDSPSYSPGSVVNFTLDAEAGGDVTYSVGDRHDFPMRETSPGHYVARYTIREGDDLANRVVRAHFRGKNGDDYWVESDRSIVVANHGLAQPMITFPKENGVVSSPLILKGTAAPYAEIQIHVASTASVLIPQFRMRGVVGDYTVTADDRGRWQSPPIHLDKVRGKDIRYVVTAWSVDDEGKKSAVSTLNLNQ